MAVTDSLKNNEYMNHLGLEFIALDNDNAVARFPFDGKLLNPYKSLHGGVLYSVADIVCGSLACMCGKYCTTVSGNMNYLAPGTANKYLECRATLNRAGSHMVFVSCEIVSDTGARVATASFTFYKTEIDA